VNHILIGMVLLSNRLQEIPKYIFSCENILSMSGMMHSGSDVTWYSL